MHLLNDKFSSTSSSVPFTSACQLPVNAPDNTAAILFKKVSNGAGSAESRPENNSLAKEFTLNQAYLSGIAFSEEVLRAQERERQKLATDLQDDIGQSLILIKNQVSRFKHHFPELNESKDALNILAELVTETLQKIRIIAFSLRPYELNLFGLSHAICSLTEQVAAAVTWSLTVDLPLVNNYYPPENEIIIYRLLQECFLIVAKHADVKAVHLRAQADASAVEWKLEVAGSELLYNFLKESQSADFHLLRVRELLKIMAGNIIFTQSGAQMVTINLRIPVFSSSETDEKA